MPSLFPNVLTPCPPALFRGTGEPHKERSERCGEAPGRASPAWLGSGSVPYRPQYFGGRRGAQTHTQEREKPPRPLVTPPQAWRGAHTHTPGGTRNRANPNASEPGAYILLLAVTSRLVLEAGPAAFLLQWTRGLAGSSVLLAALGAQKVTGFGRDGERAGGVDLPAEPLVQ